MINEVLNGTSCVFPFLCVVYVFLLLVSLVVVFVVIVLAATEQLYKSIIMLVGWPVKGGLEVGVGGAFETVVVYIYYPFPKF